MNGHSHKSEVQLVIVGDYLFDPAEGMLSGPSGAHHMCPRMAALLGRLVENPCRVVSRDSLIDELWADEPEPSSSLTQSIGRLRQYFGDTARIANYIETVPRRGYRLVAPVYGSTRTATLPRPSAAISHSHGSRLYHIVQEFRKRKVCRAMLVYAIVIWLVLQISEIVVPALNLPDWVNSLVVLLSILGFPIAATLAWIFDLTPNGLVRERREGTGAETSVYRKPGDLVFDSILAATAVALCVMLVVSSFDSSLLSLTDAKADETTQSQGTGEQGGKQGPLACLDLLTQTD